MVWRFLKKLGIKPPYDPAIPFQGIYPEETKIEKDTCIPLFIPALFTIARTWNQLRCPSTAEWIKKLWYLYAMEDYSAIKRNACESVLMRWMNLEPIIQSEVSHKEIEKYRILKTRNLFKKIRDTKGTFHAKMGLIKDRNCMDLTEAENIKKKWQEYTEELYKKDLHNQDNYDAVITHLDPDILECEVK